jgi:hypothetical protein
MFYSVIAHDILNISELEIPIFILYSWVKWIFLLILVIAKLIFFIQ